jgi:hypothetical protein
MKNLALPTIAVLALMTQAHASAVIAQCTMKSHAEVQTLPIAKGHVLWSGPDEVRVEVLEERGQWAWVNGTNSDNPGVGWVRRSSLNKCEKH